MHKKAIFSFLIIALLVACAPSLPLTSGGGSPVVRSVVPVGEPEIRDLSPTTETVWNCGSGGGTVIKHPTMTALTSYAVEWQVGERNGVGVQVGDGVIPGGVDLSKSLEGQYSTGFEQSIQQGTSWDLPAEPDTIVVYTLMWREVWQPGYVDVIQADQSVVQVYVRYRTGIQGEIVDKQLQLCGEAQQPSDQGSSQQPSSPAGSTDPVRPTSAPLPPPTPLPDTIPGTILEVGQTWRLGGLELTLVDAYYDYTPTGPGCWSCGDPGAYLTFRLTNQKPQQITVQYNLKYDVRATDNLGRDLFVGVTSNAYMDSFEEQTVLVGSGEYIYLAGWGGYGEPGMIVLVDTTDTSVYEFIVTISISSITDARWRIGVAH